MAKNKLSGVGKLLQTFRKKAGFTQSKIDMILNQRNLLTFDFEREKLKLPLLTAANYADFYNCNINDFLPVRKK